MIGCAILLAGVGVMLGASQALHVPWLVSVPPAPAPTPPRTTTAAPRTALLVAQADDPPTAAPDTAETDTVVTSADPSAHWPWVLAIGAVLGGLVSVGGHFRKPKMH